MPKFKKANYVRILKEKTIFDKGYEAGWTNEIYIIDKIIAQVPIMYQLKLIKDNKTVENKGLYYAEKLQRVELPFDTYEVTKDQLKELVDLITKVLEDRSTAHKLLPNSTGFFFGSQDYDEYYFEDLEVTKSGLEKMLADEEFCKHWDFEYHSSW